MSRISIALGTFLGVLTSLPVIAILYLGERLAGLPFVPFDLFDWLARILPGGVVTAGIDALVAIIGGLGIDDTSAAAKVIEQGAALGLVVLGGALLGMAIAAALKRRPRQGWQVGVIAGLAAFLLVAAMEISYGLTGNSATALLWLALVFIVWGGLLGRLMSHTVAVQEEDAAEGQPTSRRALLVKIASGSLITALAAWAGGRFLAMQDVETGAGQTLADLPTETPAPSTPDSTPSTTSTPETEPATTLTARERVEPVPGTRPEVTPNEEFYRIDINTRAPRIQGDSWVLEVGGLFDNARPLTLQDIQDFPSVTRPITLSCISNRIGGDLIDTSNWRGVRLRDLLDELGLQSAAQELYIEAADGFYESVTMADMMDPRTLLVYGMNGETLPVDHGFPLRIYIPNRYGMKQPKWITRIEAIAEEGAGYWVERGWSEEARPHIISIIDTVAENAVTEEGNLPIGGIAWAGDRGIRTVEVRVAGPDARGEWQEATLRTPPLSGLTWVQWRYDWPLPEGTGRYTFTVRAIDGTGTVQVGEETPPHPDGATGYHSVTATI